MQWCVSVCPLSVLQVAAWSTVLAAVTDSGRHEHVFTAEVILIKAGNNFMWANKCLPCTYTLFSIYCHRFHPMYNISLVSGMHMFNSVNSICSFEDEKCSFLLESAKNKKGEFERSHLESRERRENMCYRENEWKDCTAVKDGKRKSSIIFSLSFTENLLRARWRNIGRL